MASTAFVVQWSSMTSLQLSMRFCVRICLIKSARANVENSREKDDSTIPGRLDRVTSVLPRNIRWWISLGVVVAIATSGTIYLLTRTTRWPTAFCRPILRVVGADAVALIKLPYSPPTYINCVNVSNSAGSRQRCQTVPPPSPTGPTLASPVASTDLARLHQDALLALAHAPTNPWHAELSLYAVRTVGSPRAFMRGGAMGNFDEFARTTLGSCGVYPLGRH